MKTTVTPEQVRDYQTHGFLAVANFLEANELAEWRDAVQHAVDDRLQKMNGWTNQKPDDMSQYYAKVFTQCVRLADTSEDVARLMYDRSIAKMAATLAGVNGIRVWHDQALFKPPYGNPTGWHLDNPYWSFTSRDSISIWIALDDATLENGCMWYVPGSHKTARFDESTGRYVNCGINFHIGELFKVYPEWTTIAPVSVPAKSGTAVFHNGLCAHGAGANMTNGSRRAMTCAYMPDGATFNGQKNILPDELFNTLKAGDVLEDEKQNPLLWHKSMEGERQGT